MASCSAGSGRLTISVLDTDLTHSYRKDTQLRDQCHPDKSGHASRGDHLVARDDLYAMVQRIRSEREIGWGRAENRRSRVVRPCV